ncbi:CotH kinase family protein [Mucilaginibacter ximonensis]|uniref:CotH kinase family protein n=1 Tax=Mucilaginibacter ximonensis TaxID=538021 RepID=A0ABW5YEH6_9SPHI
MTTLFSCKKNNATPGDGKTAATTADIISAKIEVKNNTGKITADVDCTIAGDSIVAVIPEMLGSKKLALTFATKTAGTVVTVADTVQKSGVTITDYSKIVPYAATSSSGDTKLYKVIIRTFTGLPIFYINTSTGNDVTSKDTYITGNLLIDANNGYKQDVTNMSMQIKGHGNSTWTLYPKKPYKIKLDKKQSMLGMGSAKDWILVANYNDKTLMRNKIAMELARRIKSDFAPESRFVEVLLNGKYWGNYLLTSDVEINANRVNISEMTPDDVAPNITGGFLVEEDYKLDAPVNWKSTQGVPFTVKDPNVLTNNQIAYIKNYMQATEDALYAGNWTDPNLGYAKYIDADSFMRWYAVNETVKNQDSWDFSSIFYYKDKNGKLGMGPVWDFDISAGNCDYSVSKDPTGWYTRYGKWMIRLALDPAWNFKWRAMWKSMRIKEVQQMFTDIDNTATYLKLSQEQNFKRWPILNTYVYPNAVVLGSYDKEVAYMKDFITQRVAWMDANIGSY